MKKSIITFASIVVSVFVLTISAFLGVGLKLSTLKNGAEVAENATLVTSQRENQKIGENTSKESKPEIGLPVTLIVPKILIEAAIENVGLDSQERMGVPKNPDNVGWYSLGFRPGDRGNSVIAGHLDKEDGSPAVFYNLGELEIGDQINVLDSLGENHKFIITNKAIYPYDRLPLETIFGPDQRSKLNLITCDGVFNRNTRNYSQRLVIYSEMVD